MNESKKPVLPSSLPDHELRKVVATGITSLTVTLPKIHCREMGIVKGTTLKVKHTNSGFNITVWKR